MLEMTNSEGYVTVECHVLEPERDACSGNPPCGGCDACVALQIITYGGWLEPYGYATFVVTTDQMEGWLQWPTYVLDFRFFADEEHRQDVFEGLRDAV